MKLRLFKKFGNPAKFMWYDVCARVWYDVCARVWYDVCARVWYDVCARVWYDVCGCTECTCKWQCVAKVCILGLVCNYD